jgi:HlyD family secretion protein
MNTQRHSLSRALRSALLLLLTAGLVACGKPTEVQLGSTERRTLVASVSVTGVVEPETQVPVAPDVSGEVTAIYIAEGQKVTKGQLLFEIRPDNFQAALAQAEATRNSARADWNNAQAALTQARATLLQDSLEFIRNETLFRQGAITEQQFQQARLRRDLSRSATEAATQTVNAAYYRIQSTEATLRRAADDLSRTRVYASMDGTVTMMNMQVGQRVVGTGMMSGTEVVKIANLERILVKVEVNENDIVRIHRGDTASIEVDAFPDRRFRGVVTEIGYSPVSSPLASAVDQVTNYPVKILILRESYIADSSVMRGIPAHGSPFRPGMSAVVRVFVDRAADALCVPIQAVTLARADDADAGAPVASGRQVEPRRIVYVVDTATWTVRSQEVQTGISDDTHVQIKAGLSGNEQVVTGPFTTITKILKDGMTVARATSPARADR